VYAFYAVVASVLVVGAVFVGDLLLLVVLGWTPAVGAELGSHRFHLMAIAALVSTFLLGIAVQLYKSRRRAAVMVASAGLVSILGVFAVATAPQAIVQEVLPLLVLGVLAAILHPAGRKLLQLGDEFSPLLLGLTVAAAVPLLAYAADQFALQASGDVHALNGHYAQMIAIALGTILLGAIASARIAGWRIVAWLTGLLATYFGVLSVAFPAQASSVGPTWGAVTVAWAVVFVAAAEYSRVERSSSLFHRPRSAGRRSA
jgi:MFS family permease